MKIEPPQEYWETNPNGKKVTWLEFIIYTTIDLLFIGLKWGIIIGIFYGFIIFWNGVLIHHITDSLTPEQISQLAELISQIK